MFYSVRDRHNFKWWNLPNKTLKQTYINVGVYPETHAELRKLGVKGETFAEIVKRIVVDVQRVNFEILSIDGKDPSGYRVVFNLGNARYIMANGQTTLLTKP